MWPSKPPLRELTNQSFPRTPSDTLEPDWSAIRRYQVLRIESSMTSFWPCSQALYWNSASMPQQWCGVLPCQVFVFT